MVATREFYSDVPAAVEIIDCTLRDGEQAPGVWFSVEEKVRIATLLCGAGLKLLDAGFPAAGNGDAEAMQEMRRQRLPVRLGATARPIESDIAAAEEACADEVFLFMPTSDVRIQSTLGISRSRAGAIFLAGAEQVVSRGMVLNLVFEDATRADIDQMRGLLESLRAHVPIRRLVLCDTIGCATPAIMHQLTRAFLRDAAAVGVEVCMHCHNDFGLAVANTLAGVTAGAKAVTCTVNGIGERAGNADLAETAAALTFLHDVEHNIDPAGLEALAQLVELSSGIHSSPIKPVTGFNVFRHESGVHVDGMLKESCSYQFLPPDWIGRSTEYVLGKHSGSALIRHLLDRAGIAYDDALVQILLGKVKAAAESRDKGAHKRILAQVQRFRHTALRGVDLQSIMPSEKWPNRTDEEKERHGPHDQR